MIVLTSSSEQELIEKIRYESNRIDRDRKKSIVIDGTTLTYVLDNEYNC